MKRIEITSGNIEIIAELNDSKTAEAIWNALPIKARANLWGDEIYFYITTKIAPENPKAFVEVGDIAYWYDGPAFCIFFGRTPVSTNDRPKLYSPVNVFGKVIKGPENIRKIKSGAEITVERA
jgi:hypothetical protein